MLEQFEQRARGRPVPAEERKKGVLDLALAGVVAAPVGGRRLAYCGVQGQGQLGAALLVGGEGSAVVRESGEVAVQDGCLSPAMQ